MHEHPEQPDEIGAPRDDGWSAGVPATWSGEPVDIGEQAPLPAATRRGGRRTLVVAATAVVVAAGGGAIALAAGGSSPSTAPSRFAPGGPNGGPGAAGGSGSGPTAGGAADGPGTQGGSGSGGPGPGGSGPGGSGPGGSEAPGGRGFGGGFPGGGPGGIGAVFGALHGTFTVATGTSSAATRLTQRGTVTAVGGGSLAVRSADAFARTYVLPASASVDGGRAAVEDVARGDTVVVVADGSAAVVTLFDPQRLSAGGGTGMRPALLRPLHGTFVVASGSAYVTDVLQSGAVTALSSTSVSLRSSDGFTGTYALGTATRRSSGIAVGSTATVLATGGTASALGGAGSFGMPGGGPGRLRPGGGAQGYGGWGGGAPGIRPSTAPSGAAGAPGASSPGAAGGTDT